MEGRPIHSAVEVKGVVVIATGAVAEVVVRQFNYPPALTLSPLEEEVAELIVKEDRQARIQEGISKRSHTRAAGDRFHQAAIVTTEVGGQLSREVVVAAQSMLEEEVVATGAGAEVRMIMMQIKNVFFVLFCFFKLLMRFKFFTFCCYSIFCTGGYFGGGGGII